MRPSGDTARGLVFDDFVDKQVVHVSATSFRSGAELVSMAQGSVGFRWGTITGPYHANFSQVETQKFDPHWFYCLQWGCNNLFCQECSWSKFPTTNRLTLELLFSDSMYDDVIKREHFPRYWPFVRGIHGGFPSQKASDAELWCCLSRTNGWVNNQDAGDLRRHRAHYDVTLTGYKVAVFQKYCTWSRGPFYKGSRNSSKISRK